MQSPSRPRAFAKSSVQPFLRGAYSTIAALPRQTNPPCGRPFLSLFTLFACFGSMIGALAGLSPTNGVVMRVRLVVYFPATIFLFCWLCLPAGIYGGRPPQLPGSSDPSSVLNGTAMANLSAIAEIYVKGPKGEPLDRPAVVTLFRNGQAYDQGTTKAGFVKFDHVPYTELKVQVIAPGYETATKDFSVSGPGSVTVALNLEPMEAEEAAASLGLSKLSPKVRKDVGKALGALRARKPADALHPLEAAQKNAPNSPEIEYLWAVYSSQIKDDAQARAHWTKTLELNPRHLGALLSVSEDLLQGKKPADAAPYLHRAVDAEPLSWRAHALLAEALVLQSQYSDGATEAQRAIELGHERAASAELILAQALAATGERDKAIQALDAYVKSHPGDSVAAKDLETLKNRSLSVTVSADAAATELNAAAADAAALPVASNWLPPDVDESIPPVEAGASCALDEVLRGAGNRLTELIADVDRFSATESLTHESIDRFGVPSAPEKRKFDYVVSIQVLQGRYLNVEEYRNAGGVPGEFPGGVVTSGLPALVLIFHPLNVPNFQMSCEGLARTSNGLAWQVHFKQSPDKPNLIKRYRIGGDGPSYPVALKGRAWISADTFQIVRLETDLVSPVPQIRLVADHAEIEYGPVKFRDGKVNMWLPRSADVYYDWKGRRIHRRHSFSHYLLFAVEDRQKISPPKVDQPAADSGPSNSSEKP